MANYMQTAGVLARWRDVERQLEEAQDGTPEAELLQSRRRRSARKCDG